MQLSLFGPKRQPKRFNYQPVFYDEAKERRKERERKVRDELGMPPMEGDENRSAEERIRGKFTSNKSVEFARRANRSSYSKIVLLLAILVFLTFMMFGTGMEKFMKVFNF